MHGFWFYAFYAVSILFNLLLLKSIINRIGRDADRKQKAAAWDMTDVENQKRFLGEVGVVRKKLMNNSEYAVFRNIEKIVPKGLRIMAQVSMGEFINTQWGSASEPVTKKAYSAFNSKRVDMLIINQYGDPIIAIEYQGTGHNKGNYKDRDLIKKMALEKAGIELVEVFPSDQPDQYKEKVRRLLNTRRRAA